MDLISQKPLFPTSFSSSSLSKSNLSKFSPISVSSRVHTQDVMSNSCIEQPSIHINENGSVYSVSTLLWHNRLVHLPLCYETY